MNNRIVLLSDRYWCRSTQMFVVLCFFFILSANRQLLFMQPEKHRNFSPGSKTLCTICSFLRALSLRGTVLSLDAQSSSDQSVCKRTAEKFSHLWSATMQLCFCFCKTALLPCLFVTNCHHLHYQYQCNFPEKLVTELTRHHNSRKWPGNDKVMTNDKVARVISIYWKEDVFLTMVCRHLRAPFPGAHLRHLLCLCRRTPWPKTSLLSWIRNAWTISHGTWYMC